MKYKHCASNNLSAQVMASEMEFSSICRTCLGSDHLGPIFLNSEVANDIYVNIVIVTGLEVKYNDGLPQQICNACTGFIEKSLKFRQKCKKSEEKLYQLVSSKITHINRVKIESNDCQAFTSTPNGLSYKTTDDEDEKPHKKLCIKPKTPDKGTNLNTFDLPTIKLETEKHCPDKPKIDPNTSPRLSDDEDEKPLKLLCSKPDTSHKDTNPKADEPSIKLESDEPFVYNYKSTKVSCKICGKSLSIRSVDVHMAVKHPGKDRRKEKCELCDKYILRSKLNRHRMMMHGENKSSGVRCAYCKMEFNTKQELIDHVDSCNAKKKPRISSTAKQLTECDVCHKTMQRASLKTHMRVTHAGLKPVCEHCGRAFGNQHRLREHGRAAHGHPKLRCARCDYQCAGVSAMRNHARRHAGEKPFVCEECGAAFHAAYLLAQHRQSHRTERARQCPLCPAKFKTNNSLHMHKMTCHGRLMHRCHVCERAFSCRHYVVKHLRQFHDYRGEIPELGTFERGGGVGGKAGDD